MKTFASKRENIFKEFVAPGKASHLISGIINGLRDLHICVGLGVYVCVFESSKWKDGGRYNTRYMVRDHFSKGLVVFLVRQI